MTIESKYSMICNARFVLQHYGIKHQLIKTMEEMCELGAEIVRAVNEDGRQDINKIMEEIADVEVMLMQLRLHYEGSKEASTIDRIMAEKLERASSEIPPIEIDIAELDPLE